MKNIIVTGASRGIGKATKALLSSKGYNVIGTSTSGAGDNFKLDIGDQESIDSFVKELAGLKIDALINNAAILLEDWDDSTINIEQLKKTMDVNVVGTISLTEKIIPLMQESGNIVNVSSDWGSFSSDSFDEYVPHYKLSKAAINYYTKLIAHRLRTTDIIVSAINPGWIKTDMGGFAASKLPEEAAKEIVQLALDRNIESGCFWSKGQQRDW